jgi:O-6-methylguanine DNA methyltransferase
MTTQSVFKTKVIAVVKKIPKGKVLTYGQVAKLAGHPGAARAVGTIMANNDDQSIPCHRVIKSDGTVGGYNGLRGEKEALLKAEGALQ